MKTRTGRTQRRALALSLALALGATGLGVHAAEAEKKQKADTGAIEETCVEDPSTPEIECANVTTIGDGALSFGSDTTTVGANAYTDGNYSTALGSAAAAFGTAATAVGSGATANGDEATALGFNASATAQSTAVGTFAQTSGIESVAVGWGTYAGDQALAIGARSYATDFGTAVGWYSFANSFGSVALGYGVLADGQDAIGIGTWAQAWGYTSVAIGSNAQAYGNNTIALRGTAFYDESIAIGDGSNAFGHSAIALGGYYMCPEVCLPLAADAEGMNSIALGAGALATGGDNGIAIGGLSFAIGEEAISIGHASHALANQSTAIGNHSLNTRENTVSFGNARDGIYRQLTNIADGTEAHDAVTLGQLDARLAGLGTGDLGGVAAAFGGGAGWANGAWTGPSYSIQGAGFNSVGDALAAIDGYITDLRANGGNGGTGNIPTGTGDGIAIGNGSHAEHGDSVAIGNGSVADEENTVSVGSEGHERRVINVADGEHDTDAANVRQVTQAKNDAVAASRTYTDQKFNALSQQFDGFRSDVWNRLDKQDERIDNNGAMSSAMMSMSINAARGSSERGRFAVGVGVQNSQQALSVGYAKDFGRASFSIGGAFSDSDESVGIGFGIDL